ncbi:MAG: hypothetical protein ABJN04_12210 [Hyphomicrobiales bacterium]
MFLRKSFRTWSWKSFFKSEVKGSIAIESAFLLPVFALLFIGSTTLFQVQRVNSSYLHAATTLSDLVTRRIQVTDSNADDFYATAQSLVVSDDNLRVILTSVSYNATEDEYFVNWSSSNIDGEEHQDNDILRYDFPAMEASESVMLVVVEGSYNPVIQGFFDAQVDFMEHAIRRPRFVRLVDRV